MQNYEKLGAFYLGRTMSSASGEPSTEALLYDAKDLTTHGVCVGMTGSGKTGLCVSLIEEAAIDGIPVIAIDPKGDLGNLLLGFPKFRQEDFEPWVDDGAAMRKGQTRGEFAKSTAELWKRGLGQWDQDGDRIKRLHDAVDINIYTPGSDAGLPLTVLKSMAAPPAEILEDMDAFQDRVESAVSGLLGLLGINADPLRSREHILVSTLLNRAWAEGQDVSIPDLIRDIQAPPVKRIGVFELDSFYPAEDRFELAMRMNNLLASPAFASWMKGEPLDIQRLLWTKEGKPRVTILSIAHLSEPQRMFFVTLLLNEVVAWMRTQSGTTSLRALLYMDEVFGYLPPTANPPSKKPLLTLLKQARAFGVGCLLATQNPVDLDYKALSNAGTWFLGRLQTERDKMRVLDGLAGASATAGQAFDRAKIEATLSGVKSRVFLMNNVHDDAPVLFHVRWALSYLAGPLTRHQIKKLMASKRATSEAASLSPVRQAAEKFPQAHGAKATAQASLEQAARSIPPVLPSTVSQAFVTPEDLPEDGETLCYRPALLGESRIHYISARDDIDHWEVTSVLSPLEPDDDTPWSAAELLDGDGPQLESEPAEEAHYDDLPPATSKATTWRSFERELKAWLYRERATTIYKCKELKEASKPGESEADFRIRLQQSAREMRDLKIEKLRTKYTPKLGRAEERIRKAQQKIEVEKSQASQSKLTTAISIGTSILGAFFGRRTGAGTVSRAGTAVRSAGRAAKDHSDIKRAQETLRAEQLKLDQLQIEFDEDITELQDKYDTDTLELSEKILRPRKSDLQVERLVLAWLPVARTSRGKSRPLY